MADTLELIDLDVALFDAHKNEDKCEVTHDQCLITAVALGHPRCHTDGPSLVCQKVVDLAEFGIKYDYVCGDCGRPVADCWIIVPI